MGKAQILRRIHNAALKYKDYLVGNTYMFIYENQAVEVLFKRKSFLHLTGVGTKLYAEDFFDHALAPKALRPQEVLFDKEHPFDLADKKTQFLADLYKITVTDAVIATDITTVTFTYNMGIANHEFIVCLGDDLDDSGNIISPCKVPYSFRVENIDDKKYKNSYNITHVFKKKTGTKKYTEITFGKKETIKELSEEIKSKIEIPAMFSEISDLTKDI